MKVYIVCRVYIDTILLNGKVEMVTGNDTGGAHCTNGLTCGDNLSRGDRTAVKVHIGGAEAVLVVDNDVVTSGAAIAGEGHNACPAGHHGGSCGGVQVDAKMV